MIVDTREVKGNRVKTREQLLTNLDELKDPSVIIELRSLALGDILWVLRVSEIRRLHREESNTLKLEEPIEVLDIRIREFLMPWIVERKTLRDLESSVIDGR